MDDVELADGVEVASRSRSLAWWVTKMSRASSAMPRCSIDLMDTPCSPKAPAMAASTPGRSATSMRM